MIYWDTSALVPLVVEEGGTAAARELLESDGRIVVWWATAIEFTSALTRREREGELTRGELEQCRHVLLMMAGAWTEVLPTEDVRGHARRLLFRHALRAADAFQLGAALTWAAGRPDGHRFATLDARLAEAARGEGFELPLRM